MTTVKKQFFKSFILIALIPMLLASLGYVWSASFVTSLTNESYGSKLSQTMHEVERSLSSVDKLSQTLANTTWVKRIAFMQGNEIDFGQINRYDFSQYAMEIKNYASMNPLVAEIGIAFNQKDTIVTSYGIDDYDWFFNHAYQVEGMSLEDWVSILNSTEDVILYPQAVQLYDSFDHYITYVKTVRLTSLGFTITASNYEDQFGLVTLIIMMRDQSLAALLSNITEEPDASAYILDAHGNLVTSSHGDDQVLEHIKSMPLHAKPNAFRMEDGTEMVAFSVESPENGWRYIAVQPRQSMLSQIWLMKYLTTIFIILFATALIGFLLAWIFSKRTYAPIHSILNAIDQQTGAQHDGLKQKSEFEYISQMLGDYFQNNHDLKNLTQVYTPLVIHSLFVKLLYNFAAKEDMEILSKINEIPSPDTPWVAIVVLLEEKDANSLFREQLKRLQISERTVAFTLLAEQKKLVIITNAQTRKEMQETVDHVLMHGEYASGAQMHIGAGRHSSTLWEISSSYYDANHALHYQPMGKSLFSISYFDDADQKKIRGEAEFLYKETEVVAFVYQNRPDQIVQLLDELAARVGLEGEGALLSVQCLYYNLLSTAFRLSREIGFDLQDVVHEYDLAKTDSVRAMKRNIAKIYEMLCAKIVLHRQKAKSQPHDDIVLYLEQNCANEMLTLQHLSEQFHISVPYLSKMIKQQTGENFVDYLSRLRIQKAKELLGETKQSIESIGKEVGYANPLTFRRAFKKQEGVTPGAYRASLGVSSEDE